MICSSSTTMDDDPYNKALAKLMDGCQERISETVARRRCWYLKPELHLDFEDSVYEIIKKVDNCMGAHRFTENYPLGLLISECLAFSDKEQGITRKKIQPIASDQLSCRLEEIREEIELLPLKLQILAGEVCGFAATYFKALLRDEPLKIVEYFEGKRSIDEMGYNRKNAADCLTMVKIVDLMFLRQTLISGTRIVFKQSSYSLRTRLLELLSPEVRTTDVYAYSLDAAKLKNVDYLTKQENWIPDRLNFYETSVIPCLLEQMKALSERLNDHEKTIYFLKGGTASGKTTFAKQRFKHALDKNGELSGCMNPDSIKSILKTKTCKKFPLTNMQVHDEVARGPLSKRYEEILAKTDCSIIVDRPCPSYEDFQKLLNIAQKKGSKLDISELHAPLKTILERVLNRDARGKDPCMLPSEVRKSYLETLRSRVAIIKRALKEDTVNSYELYCFKKDKGLERIAEKCNKKLRVFSQEDLAKCLKVPSEARIQVKMENIKGEANLPLHKFIEYQALGKTPYEAVQQYLKDIDIELKFGSSMIQPYLGEWLSDHTNLREHIDSEQLRHVRGGDIKGRGINWQTNKFACKLNPKFNPEARIQMKMGYFIINSQYAEVLPSLGISKEVLSELMVKSEDGMFLGYRLFVHPESYSHFYPLHAAGIPYVKPEQSPFIGTPTSSYRSWIVRQVNQESDKFIPKAGSTPFIVKFGVLQPKDDSRLIPAFEVKKSHWQQSNLENRKPVPKLWAFPETFGLILNNIPNYPEKTNVGNLNINDSGMIIREIPKELLEDRCKIISFSALMSPEGTEHPEIDSTSSLNSTLPLIYDIINKTIEKGVVSSTYEFIERYLITDFFEAFEELLKDEYSLPLHAQNLCIVLDNEGIPQGFAIRDLSDIERSHRYLETYSWFYRYHVICKSFNVLVDSETYYLPPISGAPVQIGDPEPLPERSVRYYLGKKLSTSTNEKSINMFKNIRITLTEYERLLKTLDERFLALLARHFDTNNIESLIKQGVFPAAEMGSSKEVVMKEFNKKLFPLTFSGMLGEAKAVLQHRQY